MISYNDSEGKRNDLTMPTKTPIGRTTRMSFYSPGNEKPTEFPDGTWLEAEAFAYPAGGFTRRAYALCEDNVKRVVKVSIPDTYFSIPARVSYKGKYRKGLVLIDTTENVGGIRFHEENQ